MCLFHSVWTVECQSGVMDDLSQVADSCLPPTQHTVEYKALKFGDQTNSHVRIPLESTTFKKNFDVSFEFRTYYPNGLFFIASVSLLSCVFS